MVTNHPSKFVRFGIDEFRAAVSYIPGRHQEVKKTESWEFVFDIPILKVPGLAIRIYSSVDKLTGQCREKGTDSIRLGLLRTDNNMILSDQEKVLRTKGWSLRMNDKAKKLIEIAIHFVCPKCKTLLVARSGPHGPFYGCPNYPVCTFTHAYKKQL